MDPKLKKILRGISLEMRRLLEGRYDEHGHWQGGDLERRLNELGVRRDREAVPVEELPQLSPEDKAARRLVDGYLKLRDEAGVGRAAAVSEFVRESAYTWANRLFALRCLEAREIIEEVILQKPAYSGRSLAHFRFAKRHPDACAGHDDGLFAVLFAEFTARAGELPALFDPQSPAVALRPSVPALKRCVALLSGTESARGQDAATDDVFAAPDAFGWAYQYWNADEKDRVFEMVRTEKGAKIQGADIIPATQLYTEPYMVKFLVQNSLGALWMGMYPDSKLCEQWEYYVKDADRAPATRKPVREITFLDPAQGSGHFHLEAFDLFYAMYAEEAKREDRAMTPREICAAILNRNLYGIDIDGRSVQIATATLWMKAKERAPELEAGDLTSFHEQLVATNIRLPKERNHLELFLQRHREDEPLRPALELVFQGLEHADELGALLQIEEPVEAKLRQLKQESDTSRGVPVQRGLFEQTMVQGNLPVSVEDYDKWKRDALNRLRAHFEAEAQAADPVQAFFGESAGKGLTFFSILSYRFDVVVANPPYIGSKSMGAVLKSYIQHHFPAAKRDVYLAFILRCSDLGKNGRIGLVTQQAWLFLKQVAKVRKQILESRALETIGHLGAGAFNEISGAQVNVALFTAAGVPAQEQHYLTAIKVTGAEGSTAKAEGLRVACSATDSPYHYRARQSDLLSLPTQSVVYWCSDTFLRLLRSEASIGTRGYVGYTSSANGRFVRCIWEVPVGLRWLPYSKGGGFERWSGLERYSVDWGQNGARGSSYVRDHYPADKFTLWVKSEPATGPTVVWSEIGSGSFGARLLAEKAVVSRTGPGAFLGNIEEIHGLMAYMNSHAFTYLMRLLCSGLHFAYPYVAKAHVPANLAGDFAALGKECHAKKVSLVAHDLLEREFGTCALNSSSGILTTLATAAVLHSVEGAVELKAAQALSLSEKDSTTVWCDTGFPVGLNPLLIGYDCLADLPWSEGLSPERLIDSTGVERRSIVEPEMGQMRFKLKSLYSNGPGAKLESDEEDPDWDVEADEEDESEFVNLAIPAQTFLEELAGQLELHPVSVYWLLQEGIEREGWRCLPEERRLTEDRFTVMLLRLLGHRWPKQLEAGEPLPAWADQDGVIPLTSGGGGKPLIDCVHERLAEDFPGGNVAALQQEFAETMGVPLEQWLAGPFFERHISQFKKRPIAWQVETEVRGQRSEARGKGKAKKGAKAEPVFACLLYYHKLDEDLLPKIRTQYVGLLRAGFETELRTMERLTNPTADQQGRKLQLDAWVEEMKAFDVKLEQVSLSGFGPASLRPALRQYAIHDALLSLMACWLRRLEAAVWSAQPGQPPHPGPLLPGGGEGEKRAAAGSALAAWQAAAAETALHGELPQWVGEAFARLDFFCATVGPEPPGQETFAHDPTSKELAPLVCPCPAETVAQVLTLACERWWVRFAAGVLVPLKTQLKQKQEEQDRLKDELALDEVKRDYARQKALADRRDQLKREIKALREDIDQKTEKGKRLRSQIVAWTCPAAATWADWLGTQPLFDGVASLDGVRNPPATVGEFMAQESAYAPDINDGVRVNIAPMQKAGLLHVDVLDAKDADKAIADRAEWRADERRWVSEGKLPQPGWWPQAE